MSLRLTGPVFFSIAVFVFFGEVCARVANLDTLMIAPLLRDMQAPPELHMVSSNPELLYELLPGSKSMPFSTNVFHINSLGMRDIEREKQKKEGVFRIICIGASTVFGAGVNDDDTCPRYLEKLLNKKLGRPVEVWNAGVCGTVLRQQVAMARRVVESYSPDMLIFLVSNTGRRSMLAKRPFRQFFRADPQLFFENVRFIPFIKSPVGVGLFERSYFWRTIVIALNYIVTMPQNNPEYNSDTQNLKALGDFCGAYKDKIPLFAISMGLRPFGLGGKPFSLDDFPGVRPILLFAKENLPVQCGSEYFEFHPPAYVYQWYADVIARELMSSGVLNGSQKRPAGKI